MKESVRKLLLEQADAKYKEFSSALIPGSKPLIGVRLPKLRKFAAQIAKNPGWEELFDENVYFEEEMLEAMVVGYGCYRAKNLEDALAWLDVIVPSINNWSVCDSFCVSFQTCVQYPDEVLAHIEKYLCSDKEFEVRAGLILLLDHYVKIDEKGKKKARKRTLNLSDLDDSTEQKGRYLGQILTYLNRPFTQGYYAGMAAAWLVAECFVTYPCHTACFLSDSAASGNMDLFAYNKAIQKICESRIPSDEVKQFIRTKKRI